MAARIPETTRVVTIAANLDIGEWTRIHGYSPLAGSLNPALAPALAPAIDQLHYVGGHDTNVTPSVVGSFAHRHPEARVVEIAEFDHRCCWIERWPQLLSDPRDAVPAADPPAATADDVRSAFGRSRRCARLQFAAVLTVQRAAREDVAARPLPATPLPHRVAPLGLIGARHRSRDILLLRRRHLLRRVLRFPVALLRGLIGHGSRPSVAQNEGASSPGPRSPCAPVFAATSARNVTPARRGRARTDLAVDGFLSEICGNEPTAGQRCFTVPDERSKIPVACAPGPGLSVERLASCGLEPRRLL